MALLDKKMIYRRTHWQPHIAFSWNYEAQRWCYVDVEATKVHKKIVWRQAYSNSRYYSQVGIHVVEAENVIIYPEMMRSIGYKPKVNIIIGSVKAKKLRPFMDRLNQRLGVINNDGIRAWSN